MKLRIGNGFDVHKLARGYNLILGGVNIEHILGAVGHSDADVLLHAICDALLGAANLRDIGFHFPDTDSKYKDIDSKILLFETYELVKKKGFIIENIDSTIILEKPKIKEFIPQMQENISKVLNIDIDQITVKATTTEKLGFIGKQEGVAAYVVALISQRNGVSP